MISLDTAQMNRMNRLLVPELIRYILMPQASTPTKSSLTEIYTLQYPAIMSSLKNQHRFRSVDPNNRPPRPGPQQQRVPKGVADIRQTKEYKTAARRWISVIVALPILMVSSYTLYERLYTNKGPRRVGDQAQKE